MTPRRLLALVTLYILAGNAAYSQPPPATIPENDPAIKPFVAPPAPSSVTPYVLPPQAAKSGPLLPSTPPAPTLAMLVLVPHDVPPHQPIPYTIQVTNNSQADAGKVKVRMPIPEGTQVVSSDPPAVTKDNDLVWDVHSLPRGETKRLKVELKAVGNISEVQAKAYVSYEFGQTVKTRLSKPTLKVTTELPKQAITTDETIPVRVNVANNGRVPLENVKLTETISPGFEFHRDDNGETTKDPLVRTWDLGTIPAGTGKAINFRVVAKTGRDLMVVSNADSGGVAQHSHEGKLHVHDVKLKVELRGDPQANDAVANFRADVTNEGTATLTNVRVTGSVPADCKITSRTNGGQIGRDQVVWTIPKLVPGETLRFKWVIRSQVAGRKTVTAEAVGDRGLRDSQDVQTIFAGSAALNWESKFDQPTVALDKTGMFTVKLTNSGSEVAKGAKLTVTLPPEVSFVQATPGQKQDGQKLTFDARDVRPGSTEIYSITFRAEKTGQAFFDAVLDGESLGAKPMKVSKYAQITSGR